MPVLGPQFGYTDLLDHETNLRSAERDEKWQPLRPSASGKCTRVLAFDMAEYLGKASYPKEVMKPSVKRLLDLGSFVEKHLIQQFKWNVPSTLLKSRYEQTILHFYRLTAESDPSINVLIEGSNDAVFFSPDSRGLIDYKSKNDGWSATHKSRWDMMDEKLSRMKTVEKFSETAYWVEDLPAFLDELNDAFFASNFLQTNGYCCTEFMKERGIDHGAVIQSNKNDSRLREVRFKPSQALFDKVRAKFQTALNAAAAGNPHAAPADFALGSVSCAYCPRSKECRGDSDALKAFYATFNKSWPVDIAEDDPLVQAFSHFEKFEEVSASREKLEAHILADLETRNLGKIRLPNGNVYETKFLKSPKPHVELRRSKA
jgi:hypothetical protein